MGIRKNVVAAAAVVLGAMSATAANAEMVYGFGNVSINYLDWSKGTQNRTADNAAKKDFFFLEVEGGAGFNWGEVYGFFDVENPTNDTKEKDGSKNLRTAAKGTTHIYLGDTNFTLYGHIYDFRDDGYRSREQDRIVGLGYRYANDSGFWIKPFIGPAWVKSHAYNGRNGYMMGWVAGYNFNLGGEKFSVSNWHEMTFDRDEDYLEENYVGKSAGKVGQNGAVALWWHPIEKITAGVQYRYSKNKLGTPDAYQNAMIYTLKYNF
ncbi:outer membrane protein OmpK [Kistimonas scapharcae]|uniref:Outer membrane protein OmpK n=1 Tax=Kistimonas scapharcae TaxID=1036133 RepID=A0ABP8V3X8_9GAMM